MGLIFFAIVIIVIIFGYRKYKSGKRLGDIFVGLAQVLDMKYIGASNNVYRFRATKAGREVLCAFYPGTKTIESVIEFEIRTTLPYTASLVLAENPQAADTILDAAFDIETGDDSDARKALHHPVVESILSKIANRPVNGLEIEPYRLKYREQLQETSLYAEYIREALELTLQLALYLSRPDHLAPVGSVDTMLNILSMMIEDGDSTAEYNEVGTNANFLAESEDIASGADELEKNIITTEEENEIAETDDTAESEDAPFTMIFEGADDNSDSPIEVVENDDAGTSENEEADEAEDDYEAPVESVTVNEPAAAEEPEQTQPESSSDATSEIDFDELLTSVDDGKVPAADAAAKVMARGSEAIETAVKNLAEYRYRDGARAVVSALGPSAIPALVAGLGDYRLSMEIERIFEKLDEDGAQALMNQLDDSDDRDIICKILSTIGELKPNGAKEKAIPFLKNEDYRVKYEAERTIRALGLGYDEIEDLKRDAD